MISPTSTTILSPDGIIQWSVVTVLLTPVLFNLRRGDKFYCGSGPLGVPGITLSFPQKSPITVLCRPWLDLPPCPDFEFPQYIYGGGNARLPFPLEGMLQDLFQPKTVAFSTRALI